MSADVSNESAIIRAHETEPRSLEELPEWVAAFQKRFGVGAGMAGRFLATHLMMMAGGTTLDPAQTATIEASAAMSQMAAEDVVGGAIKLYRNRQAMGFLSEIFSRSKRSGKEEEFFQAVDLLQDSAQKIRTDGYGEGKLRLVTDAMCGAISRGSTAVAKARAKDVRNELDAVSDSSAIVFGCLCKQHYIISANFDFTPFTEVVLRDFEPAEFERAFSGLSIRGLAGLECRDGIPYVKLEPFGVAMAKLIADGSAFGTA